MDTRTKLLIGQENLDKIKNTKICVAGIGGVGGFVVENLIRTGVQNLCIIDFDIIEKSNLNRQIIATNLNLGRYKVEVMKERILSINPNVNLEVLAQKISQDNLDDFNFQKFDYVIDCIDNSNAKIALIVYCKENNINIISALGTGNRFGIPEYEVKDLFETRDDNLARKLRKRLRKKHIGEMPCVCSKILPDFTNKEIASVMWQPCVCGCVLSSWVLNEIVKK